MKEEKCRRTMDPVNNAETGETETELEPCYVLIPKETRCKKKEQEKLSGVVKNVHRKLRRKYREGSYASLAVSN